MLPVLMPMSVPSVLIDALAVRPTFMTLGVSASAIGAISVCDGIHCDHIAGMERAKHPYIVAKV